MMAAGLLRPPGNRVRARRIAARVAFEIAEDGRQFVEPARQGERVGGDDVEAGQPRSVVLLAPLGDGVAEHVELVEHRVVPQTQDRETALRLIRRCQRLPIFPASRKPPMRRLSSLRPSIIVRSMADCALGRGPLPAPSPRAERTA